MNLQFNIQLAIFISGTIIILFVSKKSLRNYKAHGFYRFIVFEFTLLLIALNIPYWFSNPFYPFQLISWIFLTFSIYPLIAGVYLIKKYGDSGKREENSANYNFENTTNLVTNGIYKYIRHPMYSSLLFLGLGALFKHVNVITIFIAICIIVFLVFTAKAEEIENIIFFGQPYQDYMRKTRMFIPFVF
jgi:protein-S-isoprenylcysteine O-methyltransferase Ste14